MSSHILIAQAHGKGGRRALNESQEREIARRVAKGEKKRDLADEFGVHRNTIPNICERYPEEKAGLRTEPEAATAGATSTEDTPR